MKAIRHQDRRVRNPRHFAGAILSALVLVLSVSFLILSVAAILQKTLLSG